jgi:hypothetical protein
MLLVKATASFASSAGATASPASNIDPSPDPLGRRPIDKTGNQSGLNQQSPANPTRKDAAGLPANPGLSPGQIYEVPAPSEQSLSHPFPDGLPSPLPDNVPDASVAPEGIPQVPDKAQPVTKTNPESESAANPGASTTGFPTDSLIPEFNQSLPQVSSIANPGEPPAPQSQMVNAQPAHAEQRLARLEQSVFGATFSEHDLLSRLAHLETETFGTLGNGSLEQRLAKLELKIGVQPALSASGNAVPPQPGGPSASGGALCGENEVSTLVQAIPTDEKAGEYFANIRPMNGQFARWNKVPIRLHLPQASPEAWEKNLTSAVKKWNQCVPLIVVSPNESADIDVTWVNHLTPRLLGVTRVVIKQGNMHVQIFMLRPTFYLPEVPERSLLPAFLHELGHGLGLLGHSDDPADVMYPMEFSSGSKFPSRATSIGARDINTLKKVYQSPGIESDYTAPTPIEWGSGGKE